MERLLEKIAVFKNMHVGVTGATGFIGRHLVGRLLREGSRLEIITRAQDRVRDEWRKQGNVVEKDIGDGSFELSPGTEIFFHCAGETRNPRQFHRTNVEGTRNILKACIDSGVRKFVHLSSVGVMGAEEPGTFDETKRPSPKNDYERSKLEAERLILEAGQTGKLQIAILRPSIVYGPERLPERDAFLSLAWSIKKGYFRYIGTASAVYNIVYVLDVVEALLQLALSPASGKNKIFIINEPMTWKDFAGYVQSVLGVRRKIGTVPASLARLLALACEPGRYVGVKMPFSISRFKALTSQTKFSSRRIKEELKFKFLYGNKMGIKDTIEYYQRNSLL